MATMNVVVISTDFRRATIKVSPQTYLIDVLEEACKKLNLSSDKYNLKYKNKPLELSYPIRTSNIPSGAKLELVVKSSSPTVVSVALKLPDSEAAGVPNGRLVEKFRSDTTLWQILRHLESSPSAGGGQNGRKRNFTARGVPQTTPDAGAGGKTRGSSGQLYYEAPVLLVVGRELSTLEDLQKSLSQLGITGNVLMHLSFKQNGATLHDAMSKMQEFFKEPAPETDEPAASSLSGQTSTTGAGGAIADPSHQDSEPAAANAPPTQSSPPQPTGPSGEGMEVDSGQAAAAESLAAGAHGSGRAMQVFHAPTSSTPAAALTKESDATYQPTIAHAQLHQQRLLENSHNKRLPSDKEIADRAAAEAAKLAAVKDVSIKVRFPDNTAAQWTFGSDDSAASLYAEVRAVMAHPAQPFKLVSPAAARPELVDAAGDEHRLIHGYRLAGRVVATVVWADSVPQNVRKAAFLKEAAARQAQQIPVPRPTQSPEEEDDAQPAPAKPSKGDTKGSSSGAKIPKWLKLPGKK